MSIRSESEEEITFETDSSQNLDPEEQLFENSESDEVSQASQNIETSKADEVSEAMTTIQSIITKAPEFYGERGKYFGWETTFSLMKSSSKVHHHDVREGLEEAQEIACMASSIGMHRYW